ncbi:MAG: Holliday junction branch migration protein RuvA [Candidatus Binatia bacterium]
MIAKISGSLAHKEPGEVIIDVGGVGYQLFISLGVFYRLPEIGKPVSVFVHTHVREDALQLFGFLEYEEKQTFIMMNGVSGIGPKLAIGILSGISSKELVRALREADQVRLVSIPGVGKKLAERMIVELKDKLMALPDENQMGRQDGSSQLMRDAVSALVNLGYRRGESERIVREVVNGEERNLEVVLKETLRRLSQ